MSLKNLGRAIALAIVMVSLLGSGSEAQYFGRNKIQYKDHQWKILSTPHFDIHYYQGADAFAARAGLVLEDGYEVLSCKVRDVLPWRVPVILYSSHNDFLQTNVAPQLLSEGIQAFAEPSRRRIVLPFTSSFKEFQHTAIHELAHVFTFHIIYNKMLDNVFTRMYLPGMPGWVAEGLAEYLAVGWDPDADMYIRDAVIHDYLYPFYQIQGFYVYKEGQSVFNYIAETYGHQKVLEFLDSLARTRSASAALSRTIGLTEEELFQKWNKSLRKHYWPLYPNKTEAEALGRRLTDHIKDKGYYNTNPVLSPDGERVVFFSDRSRFVEIYVMSALDGKIESKLVTGARSNRFESLHLLTSSMTWSPQGDRVAFVAKSQGHDAVFVIDVEKGKELQRIEVDAGQLAAPAWSPTEDKLVVSGTFDGQTDLVMIDLATEKVTRLTDDPQDQLTPSFFPDGKHIAFVHYPEVTIDVPKKFDEEAQLRLEMMDFTAKGNVREGASYDIWELDLETGEQTELVASPGDDTAPVILSDGKTIVYTSDVSGVNNLHTGNIETHEYHRFTDVLGGLFTPSVNEAKNRIAFSAFVKGGHDIYVSDDLEGMLARRYTEESAGTLAHSPGTALHDMAEYREPYGPEKKQPRSATTELVVARPGDANAEPEAAQTPAPEPVDTTQTAAATQPDDGTFNVESYKATAMEDKQAANSDGEIVPIDPQLDRDVPGEGPLEHGAKVSKYKTRLSPDFIGTGGGLYFSTGFGFGVANSIGLSDMLGDHYAVIAFNFYRNLEHSDLLLTYSYMKGRIDYSFGLFQFNSYLRGLSSIGEGFGDNQYFSERNYGLFSQMSIPFNKFFRMDLELQAYQSKRSFYESYSYNGYYGFGNVIDTSTRNLIEPSLSFVHDSSFWGGFGPVEGSRWRLTGARSIGVGTSDRAVSRRTLIADYRWYKTLFYRNSLALRFLAAGSWGEDPRYFYLGGPTTLRGWDRYEVGGAKAAMASVEYRFPLVDALIFGFPGRWGFTNIGGTMFFDIGSAWTKYDPVVFDRQSSGLRLDQANADFGVGAYFYLGYMLFNLQWAWPTDLQEVTDGYQFHFYFGPTF